MPSAGLTARLCAGLAEQLLSWKLATCIHSSIYSSFMHCLREHFLSTSCVPGLRWVPYRVVGKTDGPPCFPLKADSGV